MARVKTLIIEDELIIAEDMKEMLQEMNHHVIGIASDSKETAEILDQDTPDIALIDIHLRGEDDGIALALFIKEKHDIPIIFITSYSDKATVDRAKRVSPDGYIVKPFAKEDLFTSIEIALFNFANKQKPGLHPENEEARNPVTKESIFIRKDYMLIKIRFEDLVWFRSELNYLELYCREEKHLIRSTLREFMEKLPSETFLQVHKSYGVNTRYITAIDHGNVWLKDIKIPLGRAYLETVQKALNLEI